MSTVNPIGGPWDVASGWTTGCSDCARFTSGRCPVHSMTWTGAPARAQQPDWNRLITAIERLVTLLERHFDGTDAHE